MPDDVQQTNNRFDLNVGNLLRDGFALTTREVIAMLHEACRHPETAFPQRPEDLWIASTGELLIAQSEPLATPVDPCAAAASLLETMLPADDRNPELTVPQPVHGLPARLRAASRGVAPKDRRALMLILSQHLGGDARQILQQLMDRFTHPEGVAVAAPVTSHAVIAAPAMLEQAEALFEPEEEAEPSFAPEEMATALFPPEEVAAAPAAMAVPGTSDHDDLDLYRDAPPAKWATVRGGAPPQVHAARLPRRSILSALAVGAVLVAIGSASYWLLRHRAVDQRIATGRREAPIATAAERIAPPPATVTDATAAAIEGERMPSADVTDALPAQLLQLPVAGGAFSPTFATSGRELFFHAGRSNAGRLLVASLDDSGRVSRVGALLDERARNYHPRVSPDGRLLAFDSDREGERGVYVSERDGSNPQRVSGNGYGAVPSWSPNMKWLAFIRGEAARPRVWNLWLRDMSSGAVQRHTSFRYGQVWGASWFPDGRSLCYSHETQLVISHLDAREDIVIETPRRGHLVRTPAVSPDGRLVVFQVFKDGVWLLDVQTRQMQRILDDLTAEEFSWAPDGHRIAYHSRRDGAWKIWVMSVPA